MSYETEEWRKPTISEGEEEIFSEHGRILDKVDYRSHWFVLSKKQYGGYHLLVKHGGGEEGIPLGYSKRYEIMMESLESDTRYYLMHALMEAFHNGKTKGRDESTTLYRNAFVDGRLKKRKLPSKNEVRVWIESPKLSKEVQP